MSTQSIQAFTDIAAAHREWDTTGDIGTDLQYIQHLAEYLTARGWVRVHNHHTDDGEAQRAHLARVIEAGITSGGYPEEIASAGLVALLNPARGPEATR